MEKLKVRTKGTQGWQWNPILEYTEEDVFDIHRREGIPLHPAYTEFGSDRLSCAFCVVARNADHIAALACKGNHASYRRLIGLELKSSFSFKPNDWLCERDPSFLGPFADLEIEDLKKKAELRRAYVDMIPEELKYVSGWPVKKPTQKEAELLAHVRQEVNSLLQLNCSYLEPIEIIDRYHELMDLKENK
jgi:3'-phosphoadenosine 5'-phosphosulfate sulfotransferase (PAPS reductase)/FAD synthetase